ncbi:YbaK/EbsC family protein [Streptomyces bohaiensis]|uniref:YbaK/EbsC family protein n=1 Tax=Streptomyces bohaiensis TaxID=1431344 RepID=UPI003B7CFFD7
MSDATPTPFGTFDSAGPAVSHRADLPAPVAAALAAWPVAAGPVDGVLLVDSDPAHADTAVFCEAYDVRPEVSANCVVVAAKRGQEVTLAACVVLATTRLDVNRAVRKHLGARKASFAPMEEAVTATGMEYGGITPVGLPDHWPLLVDARVTATPHVLVGSGARRGKLILPGAALAALPNAEVITDLAG